MQNYLDNMKDSDLFTKINLSRIAKTRMFRWINGVVVGERKRSRTGVASITDEMRVNRFRWPGHVLRSSRFTTPEHITPLTISRIMVGGG